MRTVLFSLSVAVGVLAAPGPATASTVPVGSTATLPSQPQLVLLAADDFPPPSPFTPIDPRDATAPSATVEDQSAQTAAMAGPRRRAIVLGGLGLVIAVSAYIRQVFALGGHRDPYTETRGR